MQNIYGEYSTELGRHEKHRNELSVRNKACETQHCLSIICGKTGLTYVLIFPLHCSSALYTGLAWRRPRAAQNTSCPPKKLIVGSNARKHSLVAIVTGNRFYKEPAKVLGIS